MRASAASRSPADRLANAFRVDRADLWHYARRRLGDDTVADDAVQETFLRAWRSIHRYRDDRGSARMWLFGICRNAVTDVARQRVRELPQAGVDPGVYPGDAADDAADRCCPRGRADHALAAMTPPQRDAVVQVLVLERPYADAAATLGVPVGTVKSRVHHGVSRARRASA